MDYLMCDQSLDVLKDSMKNEIVYMSEEHVQSELIGKMNKYFGEDVHVLKVNKDK